MSDARERLIQAGARSLQPKEPEVLRGSAERLLDLWTSEEHAPDLASLVVEHSEKYLDAKLDAEGAGVFMLRAEAERDALRSELDEAVALLRVFADYAEVFSHQPETVDFTTGVVRLSDLRRARDTLARIEGSDK